MSYFTSHDLNVYITTLLTREDILNNSSASNTDLIELKDISLTIPSHSIISTNKSGLGTINSTTHHLGNINEARVSISTYLTKNEDNVLSDHYLWNSVSGNSNVITNSVSFNETSSIYSVPISIVVHDSVNNSFHLFLNGLVSSASIQLDLNDIPYTTWELVFTSYEEIQLGSLPTLFYTATPSSESNACRIRPSNSPLVQSTGEYYTFSVFAKQNIGISKITLVLALATSKQVVYDLNTGSIDSGDTSNATINYIGNGWYRLSYTRRAELSGATIFPYVYLGNTVDPEPITNSLFIAGAQLEVFDSMGTYHNTQGISAGYNNKLLISEIFTNSYWFKGEMTISSPATFSAPVSITSTNRKTQPILIAKNTISTINNYNIPITSFSLTINNTLSIIQREKVARKTSPTSVVILNRSINGSFSCLLDDSGDSGKLLQAILRGHNKDASISIGSLLDIDIPSIFYNNSNIQLEDFAVYDIAFLASYNSINNIITITFN